MRARPVCLLPAAFALLLVMPSLGHAQINDTRLQRGHAQALVTRIVELYAVTKGHRDQMLRKAEELASHTQEIVDMRKRYERRAVGELAKLGEGIPDLRDYGNVCAVEIRGETICTAQRSLLRRYERALRTTFYKYQGEALNRVNNVQADLDILVGREVSKLADARFATSVVATGHIVSAGEQDEFVAVGAIDLSDAAAAIDAALDAILLEEFEEADGAAKMVSSGRAQQVTADLSYAEAVLELEIARQKVRTLQQATLSTGGSILSVRRGQVTLRTGLSW
jgi:hypothetical protein